MPTHERNAFLGNRFEVEVIPVEDSPVDLASRVLSLSNVSPIRSVSTLDLPTAAGKIKSKNNYYEPVALTRAIINDTYLFDWRQNWHAGIKDYRDVMIRPLQESLPEPRWQWKLSKCWPHLWEGPEFDAMESNIIFETLELYYSEVEWMSV